MSNEVFANGNEIACKSGDGKSIAAFPDVCLSPPSPPAGPIPVPYPNTSLSKDTKNGSKTVKIDGKEVMLKDQSFYKTSPLGNEAATKTLGAGVVSHVITGKTYFVAWSMDVKFEGQNVDRHIDLTTTNHASPMGDGAMTSEVEGAAPSREKPKCECCNKDLHGSQTGGEVVSEEEWYDLNEQIPDDPQQPHPGNKRAMKAWAKEKEDLANRRKKLNNRRRRVAQANKCPSAPQPPCNVYRKITAEQTQLAEEEWAGASNEWKDRNNVPFVKSTKKRKGKKIPQRGQANHKVPKSAGGCPTGDGNLQSHEAMSKECQEADDELGKAQGECAKKWDAEIKASV